MTNPPVVFSSETAILLAATDINKQLDILYQQLCHQMDTYESQGSSWVLLRLVSLQLNVIEYDPLRASSYIEVPKMI